MRTYFSAFGLALVTAALVAGCAEVPHSDAARVPAAQPLARLDVPVDPARTNASAWVIAAEFALDDHRTAEATVDYARAAQISRDPAIASRALQLALAMQDAGLAGKLLARRQALGASGHELAEARARLAMLRGDRNVAERQFRILLAPGRARNWNTFVAALLSTRDTALAGQILEDLVAPARLPRDEGVWVALSQAAEHLGRHTLARQLADAAVRRFHGADAFGWAASLHLSAGDRPGARALYAEGVARHPRNVDLRLGYAAVLGDAGQDRKALAVLARGPQSNATWTAQVAYAARAKDGHKALRRVYADLSHTPAAERRGSTFLLGQVAELLGHDRAALAWYGKVDVDGAHGFEAQIRQVVLLDKTGRPSRAHALAIELERDYAGDPDSLRAAYAVGAELYSQHGDPTRAIAVYDRGLAALPGDPTLLYGRGIAEANTGNASAALADFREVLQRQPGNVEAMNALGFTLADADHDLPEAKTLLHKALVAEPHSAAVMDSWGWLQYRLGNLDESVKYLKRAWARQPDPDIGVHLGEVLWKLGQLHHAREVFAKVRTLDPHNTALERVERKLHP